MASVNKVILVGNSARDSEIRYLPSGQAIANITIATSTKRKDKASGDYIEETQWHRVTFFDRLAEIAGEFVKKGSPLYVEGRLTYRKYTDKNGVEKQSTDIIATEMQLLGSKERQESQAPRPSHDAAKARQAPRPAGGAGGFDDMDDDIPFADPLARRGAHLVY